MFSAALRGAVVSLVLALSAILAGGVSAAAAANPVTPGYVYDISSHVYDTTANSVQAHSSEAVLGASHHTSEGAQGTVTDTAVPLSVSLLKSVAANTETAFTRFTLNRLGETTLNLRLGSGSIEVPEHAALRMTQRGISTDSAEATLTQTPCQHTLERAVRTGYYDPLTLVFVGTVDDTVTTVIGNVNPQVIENLEAG